MSCNHSLKGFSSTVSTIRIDSPELGDGAAPSSRPSRSQRSQLVVRCIAALFALIAMALFAASISYTDTNYINILGTGDWTDGLALAPAALALILNPVLIFTVHRRQRRSAGAPWWRQAAAVAVDLVLVGLAVPGVVYGVGGAMFWNWAPAISSGDGTVSCTFWYNDYSPECMPVAYTIGKCQMAANAFLALVALLHLGLFAAGLAELARSRLAAERGFPRAGFEMAVPNKEGEGHGLPTSVYQ